MCVCVCGGIITVFVSAFFQGHCEKARGIKCRHKNPAVSSLGGIAAVHETGVITGFFPDRFLNAHSVLLASTFSSDGNHVYW